MKYSRRRLNGSTARGSKVIADDGTFGVGASSRGQ
jgi:hypothetical protein